jgi:hypothetical protein
MTFTKVHNGVFNIFPNIGITLRELAKVYNEVFNVLATLQPPWVNHHPH